MNKGGGDCRHPLFVWASEGAWSHAPDGLHRPCVFVFERKRFLEPTTEQLEKYRSNRIIVENHGGRMVKQEWEIAGESSPLSECEVQEIISAVTRDNPDATIITHWNGKGCYTMSVGVDFKKDTLSAHDENPDPVAASEESANV